MEKKKHNANNTGLPKWSRIERILSREIICSVCVYLFPGEGSYVWKKKLGKVGEWGGY